MRTRREILGLAARLGGAVAVGGLASAWPRSAGGEPILERVPGAVAAYETVDDIQEVADADFEERTAEGFTVVLFYGSRPPSESAGKMDRAGRIYVMVANELGLDEEQVLRYDRQRVADMLGDTSAVPDHTDELYSVRGTPTILAFCHGEEVYRMEGTSAPEDRLHDAVNYFVSELVKVRAKCL